MFCDAARAEVAQAQAGRGGAAGALSPQPSPGAQVFVPEPAHMVRGSPAAAEGEGVAAPGHRFFQGGCLCRSSQSSSASYENAKHSIKCCLVTCKFFLRILPFVHKMSISSSMWN